MQNIGKLISYIFFISYILHMKCIDNCVYFKTCLESELGSLKSCLSIAFFKKQFNNVKYREIIHLHLHMCCCNGTIVFIHQYKMVPNFSHLSETCKYIGGLATKKMAPMCECECIYVWTCAEQCPLMDWPSYRVYSCFTHMIYIYTYIYIYICMCDVTHTNANTVI